MRTRSPLPALSRLAARAAAAALVAACAVGCATFDPATIPIIAPTLQERTEIFEEPGALIALEGLTCSESNASGMEQIIRLAEAYELPEYATNATVYLNGWDMRFLQDDHHVTGLGAAILDVELVPGALEWEAIGMLTDHNFDDGYEWCYRYVVVAWNQAEVDAFVLHDEDKDCYDELDCFDVSSTDSSTALTSLAAWQQLLPLASRHNAGTLPRGFAFGYEDTSDHEFYQLAYQLGFAEAMIDGSKDYAGGQPPLPNDHTYARSGYVSWESLGILKDKANKRPFGFGELVSAFGGHDVGFVQAPFTVLPLGPSCSGPSRSGVDVEDLVIENLPYDYALPVLSGWDLSYCSGEDHHLTRAGTWLSGTDWQKPAGALLGDLHLNVSTILRDKDSSPGYRARTRVNVLGFRISGSPQDPGEEAPDLTVTADSASCRMDVFGNLLVTVENRGTDLAGFSTTEVDFGPGGTTTVSTPAVSAPGATALEVPVPSSCWAPDCHYVIRADAGDALAEIDESNNQRAGVCRLVR